MADQWMKATIMNGYGRVVAAVTTELVGELQRRHQTWPTATAALGRTATVGAMMASLMKEEERLTLQIRGDGPLGGITVDADTTGRVRGYVQNPRVHLPPNSLGKLDVGKAVGAGELYVMRDMGMKDFYKGGVELQTGEIGDDFTYYFAVSEQTPSAVAAGVLVDTDNSVIAAGGFIAQLLPLHTDEHTALLEERIARITSVTDLLVSGLDAKGFITLLDTEASSFSSGDIRFECTCSRERLRDVLKGLGQAEVESMIADDNGAQLVCHYCNSTYNFSAADLAQILSELRGGER